MSLFNDIKPAAFSNINQLLRPRPKSNILSQRVVVPTIQDNQSPSQKSNIEAPSPVLKFGANDNTNSANTSIETNTHDVLSSIEVNTSGPNASIEHNIPSPKSSIEEIKTKTVDFGIVDSNTQTALIAPNLVTDSKTGPKSADDTPHVRKNASRQYRQNIKNDENTGVVSSIEQITPSPISSIEDFSHRPIASAEDKGLVAVSSIEVFKPAFFSIRFRSNFTKVPNSLVKNLRHFEKNEFLVYLFLLRQSYGWNKNITNIPISKYFLEKALGLNKKTIIRAINSLISKKLIDEQYPSQNKFSPPRYLVRYHASDDSLTDTITSKDFFCLDNNILNCGLTGVNFLVFFLLSYYSHGRFKSHTENIFTMDLAAQTGISTRSIQEAIRTLLGLGLIKRINNEKSSNGIIYSVAVVHEVFPNVETKTLYENTDAAKSFTSIEDNAGSPISSIEVLSDSSPISSIEDFSGKSNNNNNLGTLQSNKPLSSIEELPSKERQQNIKKTSSGDADDFLNFTKSNLNPETRFQLSKENIEVYTTSFGLETCKQNLLRLKFRLTSAANPVGLWIDSLKNPQNYPELSQKTEAERLTEQRIVDEQKRLEQRLKEKEEQETKLKIERIWSYLPDSEKEIYSQKSRAHFGSMTAGGLSLPPRAILERAMKIAFEEKTQKLAE